MRRCFITLLFFSIPAFAQDLRGTIGGVVTDATSSPIAGAKVNITELQTGTRVQLETDGSGRYAGTSLLPGDYEIRVQF